MFTTYEKFIIALLATLQFTITLDFMVMSPLGAILMPTLGITPQQFGLVVSSYAFSAGISGLLAAGFADKFDRKKLLLFFYIGFIIGTFCCAIAPNYLFLILARIVTGVFGGVIGAVSMAIVTDIFPMERRGRVMGFMSMGFSLSQVAGIPLSLFLANHFGWHTPFLLIVFIGIAIGIVTIQFMRPINAHLALQSQDNAFQHLGKALSKFKYLRAFLTTGLLSVGGFMIMPFSSAFLVNNVKVTTEQLPIIFMVTGIASIFILPNVGRLSDKIGKFKVFVLGSALSILLVIIYTNLGTSPFWVVMLVNTLLFAGIMSRAIPASALLSAIPTPQDRGAFMGLNSSIQQISGGIASVLGGMIVVQNADNTLSHFDTLGYIASVIIIVCLSLMYVIHRDLLTTKQ
jgi:predicted MFS family arabinose efflux permease